MGGQFFWQIWLIKLFQKNKQIQSLLKKHFFEKVERHQIHWRDKSFEAFWNFSSKPCDILTGASFGAFYLGTKPTAI